jgi:hypothetical protein
MKKIMSLKKKRMSGLNKRCSKIDNILSRVSLGGRSEGNMWMLGNALKTILGARNGFNDAQVKIELRKVVGAMETP